MLEKKQMDLGPGVEVAKVLRQGLKSADVSPAVKDQIEKWCKNEEDYSRALSDKFAPAVEAFRNNKF